LRRALEALGLAVVLAFLPELVRARTGVVIEPHPAWIAVLVLAARDGSGGFFMGLIATAIAVTAATAFTGSSLAVSWSRLDSGPNLIAFGACLTVSWFASWHVRRQEDLRERLRTLSDRSAGADATIAALRDVVATLRARVDRTSASLSFLRDVASRLEGKDPVAAAEAAVDLALARTGAGAAAIKVGMGRFQRLLAVRDARGAEAFAPLAVRDADVTVPIRNLNDQVGVIALWGIPGSELDVATTHDLAVIASWCVPALAIAAWRPRDAANCIRRAM
jgi:uncharacterized coiled-coil protein SlyX